MNDRNLEKEFEKLVTQYQGIESNSLDKAIDAVLTLKEDGQITEELATKTIKIFLSRYVSHEIRKDIQNSDLDILKDRGRKLSFMGIRYGKREEHFAI